jgi:hypothetical protein
VDAILALIHRWNLPQFLYNWQTLIAGLLAVGAAWRTIRATTESADREVEASKAQTAVAQQQIETTVRLEDLRKAREALAFLAMLQAAMTRVLAEADRARETYKTTFTPSDAPSSREALAVRQCITKGGFAELRAACVRQGSPLTSEFLDLEREIDSFSGQWQDEVPQAGVTIRKGKLAGLGEQLAVIEAKATELFDKAVAEMAPTVPGPFATAEAEALIGAPAPEARRSWLRWWFGWREAG